MTDSEFAWQSLLHTDAPPACPLKAALFTTYDRADECLLAEHLLPLLLKLSREPDGEGTERQYFLLELDQRLKHLHDRLIVVSSTSREEPADAEEAESGTYEWIWRSIRHLTVGSKGKAVQHAKLWLLHWGAADADGVEYLELVVSSANLTRAAFRGQLQAAWRVCLALHPHRSKARLDSWGILPDFLRELATSAGDDGHFTPFIELLARGDCPNGISFVASIPGTHSRQELRRTAWGAAGLREIAPSGRGTVSVAILAPFVGSWGADAISRWCAAFDGSPDRLTLVWIDQSHPWARAEKWLLPESTLKTLEKLDATLLKLRHSPDEWEETDAFHDEHRLADDRWSHAKVYSLTRGNSRRLLVTSANFSPAAWGKQTDVDGLAIENFELGVCIEQAAWPLDDLQPFASVDDVATVTDLPSRGSALILWARAIWDGNAVAIDCRCEAGRELVGEVQSCGMSLPVTKWTVDADGRCRSAHVLWADSKQLPMLVQLACEEEMVRVPIFDGRSARDREDTIPPEVDENVAQSLRDELLFELYGGRVAADAEGERRHQGEDELGQDDVQDGTGRTDSYAVPKFVLARRHLSIVDNWADQVNRAAVSGTGEFERHVLRRDGELLVEAFKRQVDRDSKKGAACAIGARLAAEELSLRLKRFEESDATN
jgi:hypothetical protein